VKDWHESEWRRLVALVASKEPNDVARFAEIMDTATANEAVVQLKSALDRRQLAVVKTAPKKPVSVEINVLPVEPLSFD
jgi:chromosome segregation and condensation protein ScpB